MACLCLGAGDAACEPAGIIRDVFDGVEPVVHLRTYYWDSQSTSGAPSEAWAAGGWGGLATRWYGDAVQLGVVGYTSQKLYGPADKGGSLLLGPGQDAITVLGRAYGSIRYLGQTFTGYRQAIDQPWVSRSTSRPSVSRVLRQVRDTATAGARSTPRHAHRLARARDRRFGFVQLGKTTPLPGLSYGVEGSWLDQSGATAQGQQLRVYANYEFTCGR